MGQQVYEGAHSQLAAFIAWVQRKADAEGTTFGLLIDLASYDVRAIPQHQWGLLPADATFCKVIRPQVVTRKEAA